ncbi:MAG: GGDEF domain-containing protein [Rhizobiaceae bacterium]
MTKLAQKQLSTNPQQKLLAPSTKETASQEMTNAQLVAEVSRLKGMLADMRSRTDVVDPITGLPKRARFMELAGAEFNRTRRYEHNLTLVVATIAGHQRILQTMGEEAADQVATSVAEICTSSTRFGVDILGRLSDDKIAMLLPETDLKGGELCLERMRKLVAAMPITIDGREVKVGLSVKARALKEDQNSFVELLVTAT